MTSRILIKRNEKKYTGSLETIKTDSIDDDSDRKRRHDDEKQSSSKDNYCYSPTYANVQTKGQGQEVDSDFLGWLNGPRYSRPSSSSDDVESCSESESLGSKKRYNYSTETFIEESSSEDSIDLEDSINLENGITILPKVKSFLLHKTFSRFQTIHMSVSERNFNLKDFELPDGRNFASDIFKVVPRLRNGVPANFQIPSSRIMYNVPVFLGNLQGDHTNVQELYDFIVAYKERMSNSWKECQAEYERGCVNFSLCLVDCFCILSKPRKLSQVVCPQGATLRTGTDGRIIVKVPPQCVRQDRTILYQILSPETTIDELSKYWKPQLLVSVSETVNISSSGTIPIHLSFPKQSGYRIRGTTERLIGIKNGKPKYLPMVTRSENRKNLYEVTNCKSVALGTVYTHNAGNLSLLKREYDVFYGHQILCKLLLFCKTMRQTSQLELLVSVALLSDVNKTLMEAHKNNFRDVYRSDPLCFSPLQRIRIHLMGQLNAVSGSSRENYFFTFVSKSKENTIKFPVHLRTGGQPYGIVEFSNDRLNRGRSIAELHFDTFYPFKLRRKNEDSSLYM